MVKVGVDGVVVEMEERKDRGLCLGLLLCGTEGLGCVIGTTALLGLGVPSLLLLFVMVKERGEAKEDKTD